MYAARSGTRSGHSAKFSLMPNRAAMIQGLPVIIVIHTGNKTGAVRKTLLMRAKDGDSYVLVGSKPVVRLWCDLYGFAR